MLDPLSIWAGSVVAHLPKWLDIFQREGSINAERKTAAMRKVRLALDVTSTYVKWITAEVKTLGLRFDNEKEAELSRLWKDVALDIRHFDKDFAKVCDMKGNYWLNPSTWTYEQISEAGFAITQLQERVNAFFDSK